MFLNIKFTKLGQEMRYECIKCCSPTDNDSDVCDACEEQGRKEYLSGLEWETKQQQTKIERLLAALKPFADAVIIVNGDVEISTDHIRADHYADAAKAFRNSQS